MWAITSAVFSAISLFLIADADGTRIGHDMQRILISSTSYILYLLTNGAVQVCKRH
jgi:hypothetical protein